MKTMPCEIITPEKVFLRDKADFVVAPGTEGELGVMPGHARLIARLKKGELRIVNGRDTKRYLVEEGFIHIKPSSVKILVPALQPLPL